jgi:hypothetical protein
VQLLSFQKIPLWRTGFSANANDIQPFPIIAKFPVGMKTATCTLLLSSIISGDQPLDGCKNDISPIRFCPEAAVSVL